LQGIKMKSKETKELVDAFEIHVGGTLKQGGEFNRKLKGKIDSQHLPAVLKQFLLHFKEQKQPEESFHSFVHRVGVDKLQQVLDEILERTLPKVAS
ncbi:MAG: nitrite/sulfite reductase, partial [Firmicutes bacterium]|nr:nitrite/sulfite reductase [Bacillota bacterium]